MWCSGRRQSTREGRGSAKATNPPPKQKLLTSICCIISRHIARCVVFQCVIILKLVTLILLLMKEGEKYKGAEPGPNDPSPGRSDGSGVDTVASLVFMELEAGGIFDSRQMALIRRVLGPCLASSPPLILRVQDMEPDGTGGAGEARRRSGRDRGTAAGDVSGHGGRSEGSRSPCPFLRGPAGPSSSEGTVQVPPPKTNSTGRSFL
jgi:hypothetical protein